ncbi:MAG: glycogen debranching protein GlgX [Pseudomonadota bacterium]
MIEAGDPTRLGASAITGGVNFALYSSCATRVELCLFDKQGRETRRIDMPECHNNVWHGFIPTMKPGQSYGYRIHGPWAPAKGQWCNPHKLMIDPYAKALSGSFQWQAELFGGADARMDTRDSADFVPKGIVTKPFERVNKRLLTAWQDSVILETNVRGYTMRHPDIRERDRGKFRGLANKAIIAHLKSLGITAIELLPVQYFVDEQFLDQKGLANAWGYNTLNFFAPMSRYAGDTPRAEFRNMVDALHEAGIEVILDVVYNHTAEGGGGGPLLSFRGIDNLSYYRLMPDQPAVYINDTGTGNTINADHPAVQQLILDSLRYWATEMGVDGFRFDLAPILGRSFDGYRVDHPLLHRITHDRVLRHCKLIAEPWDIGPGGYQLGHFPQGWSEWNDRYRDSVRRFWRGDEQQAPAVARSLHGSADLFEKSQRNPSASINFITAHDGFTLRDLVSYRERHNEANGENNLDGHAHNYSDHYGVEGDTDDADILALRARQKLNLMATLLFSQGTPMLLGGDELSHTQQGNNNAYAQDNELTWVDWDNTDGAFLEQVRKLIALRRNTPLLRQRGYRHGRNSNSSGLHNIEWRAADGTQLHGLAWHHVKAMTLLLVATAYDDPPSPAHAAVAIAMNPTDDTLDFTLPPMLDQGGWSLEFHSAEALIKEPLDSLPMAPQSLACLFWRIAI